MNLKQKLIDIVTETNLRTEEPMKLHTTFRIGGSAEFFAEPETESQIAELVRLCRKEQIPYMILGRGSNMLVSDDGIRGVVICLQSRWTACEADGEYITAQSGATLSSVAQLACKMGLAGLEFASGIPGTVGGGLRMNAGAYGGEMKDVVVSARVLTEEGTIISLSNEELQFGYRSSIIGKKGYTVLSCTMKLMPGDPEEIRNRMQDFNGRRREKQPLEYPSAGSMFKRPEGFFAGKLIQDAGLKGYRVGDAQVSEKHAGFVVNRGNATAAEIIKLCQDVQKKVNEQFGIVLEMEVRKVGSFPPEDGA